MRRVQRAVVAALVMTLVLPLGAVAEADSPPAVSFGAKTDLPAGTFPQSVALGDLDGDGAQDLVVANRGWFDFGPGVIGSVSVSLGDGSGGFGARTDYDLGAQVRSVALADLDGDTALDLVVSANGSGLGKLWVLLGDGAGGFGPKAETLAGSQLGPGSLVAADLNGDTVPDVAVADSESVNVLLGDGSGGFAGDPQWPVLENWNGTYPNAVSVGDLNSDPFPDLVVANWGDTVSVLLGNGDGTFQPALELATGSNPRSVVVADLNGDGSVDLATANSAGGSASVLLGNGDGSFLPSASFAAATASASMAAADVNGDARLDLVATSFSDDSVSVLVGDGAGAFAAPVEFAAGWGAYAVAAGDLDGDGLPDLAVTNVMSDNSDPGLGDPNPGPGTVSVLLNTPPTAPQAPTIGSATAGNGRATVSWTPPASDGGSPVTGYVVTPFVGYWSGTPRVFSSTATSQTVTGLTNGWRYRFRVQAINAIGVGGYSMVTNAVTPAVPTVPGAPTIGTATAGNGRATVSWTSPASDGGSPVTGYVVTPFVGDWSGTPRVFSSTATSQTVTGLTNGWRYRFRVQAINAVGTGPHSALTNAVTPTV